MGIYVLASELGRYYPDSRVIDLADGDKETETLATLAPGTAARLEARIANAEAEAHGYLQGRFSLPITPVPERLKLAVGKLAIYYLYEDKQELWEAGKNPLGDQYDIHREWLEGVKESDMFIGSGDVPVVTNEGVMSAADGPVGRFAGGGISDFG